ncbi:MAG: hypothetical protein WCL14_01520 [Bacteroidota bacterium]
MKKSKIKEMGWLKRRIASAFILILLAVVGKMLDEKNVMQLHANLNLLDPNRKDRKRSFWNRFFNNLKRLAFKQESNPLEAFNKSLKVGGLFDINRIGKKEMETFRFIMMSTPTPENKIIGILGKIPNLSLRHGWAKAFIDAIETSSYMPSPDPSIASCRAHLLTYKNAKTQGRKAAWVFVINDLNAQLAAFQRLADNDHKNSVLILESGGFKIKRTGKKQRQVFKLTHGGSGIINMVATGGGKKKHCHAWWKSDNGVDYTMMLPTTDAETTAKGLKVGSLMYFQHQLITKKGATGKLETLSLTVI